MPTEDSVSLCSVYTRESPGWSPGRYSNMPSVAILVFLWLCSKPLLYPLCPATHQLTAVPIRQHWVLFLPLSNPGCPCHQEPNAWNLMLEWMNKVEERKKEQCRPSPTSPLPVLLVDKYRLTCHWHFVQTHTVGFSEWESLQPLLPATLAKAET